MMHLPLFSALFDAVEARPSILETIEQAGYQVEFHSHAQAILSVDFPDAVRELDAVLRDISIPIEEIIGSGGGEALGTQRLRHGLSRKGWRKTNFEIRKTINGIERESISHEIDHVKTFPKGLIALEIEWNNKDPFFDRDLENFKRLHAEGAISVGIVVTRGTSMQESLRDFVARFATERRWQRHEDVAQFGLERTARQRREVDKRVRSGMAFADAWAAQFVSDKFGPASTHWAKLEDRVRRGVGNPCPLVLIGLPASIVTFNEKLDLEDIEAADQQLIRQGIVSPD
jgi:hypothetical protein